MSRQSLADPERVSALKVGEEARRGSLSSAKDSGSGVRFELMTWSVRNKFRLLQGGTDKMLSEVAAYLIRTGTQAADCPDPGSCSSDRWVGPLSVAQHWLEPERCRALGETSTEPLSLSASELLARPGRLFPRRWRAKGGCLFLFSTAPPRSTQQSASAKS